MKNRWEISGRVIVFSYANCMLYSLTHFFLSLWLPWCHSHMWIPNYVRTSQVSSLTFLLNNSIIKFSPKVFISFMRLFSTHAGFYMQSSHTPFFFHLYKYLHLMWVSTYSIIQAITCLSIITSWLEGVYATNYFASTLNNYGEMLSLKFFAFQMAKVQRT